MRVLVVEDELLIAAAMQDSLEDEGHTVVGPFKRIADALSAIRDDVSIDAALLDVNVRDEPVFPVAEALARRGIPFVFCTGYAEMQLIPEAYRRYACLNKPCDPLVVIKTLERAQGSGSRPRAQSLGT